MGCLTSRGMRVSVKNYAMPRGVMAGVADALGVYVSSGLSPIGQEVL